VIEVDKCVGWPELGSQILPGDDLAGVLEQLQQELRWLFLEANGDAIPPQFRCSPFDFEGPETPVLRVFGYSGHKTRPVTEECTPAVRLGIWKTIARDGISRRPNA
jgi:hypothetical protein